MNINVCGAVMVEKDQKIDKNGVSTPVSGLVAQSGRDRAGATNGAREDMYVFITTSADWHGAMMPTGQQGAAGNEMTTALTFSQPGS
jgi:hypothetical protein